MLSPDETQPALFSLPIGDWVYSALGRADLVIAEISGRSPNVFVEIGVAQAMGKPSLFLIDEQVSVPLVDTRVGNYIQYNHTTEGLARLRSRFRRFLEDFRRYPRRFRPLGGLALPFASAPFVDLEKVEPREFENLCFELLSQMGFRRVEWGKELREIDVVATLPKKDPDGFEYQELWLITMGLHAPIEMLIEMATQEPELILNRILARSETTERLRASFRPDTPITLLFILFRDDPPAGFIERALKRAERRLRDRPYPITLRFRIWDRQHLLQLIRQFPQIGYKYFSEEGRAQSKYRKTPEELYRENVELTERLQATLTALREERDKRARAERDAVWKDLSFTAAHKLGNPIFALETDLQGLKRRIEDRASDALEVAEEMGTSLEKAKVIVEQFKSLTKAQEISPRPVDIAPLLNSACRIAKQSGIHLQIRVPQERPNVMADPNRITECFDELVANAMHWFDKPEKRILVTVEMPKRKGLPPTLDQSQRYLRIRFEDNGCGVPLEAKQRIFAPFYTTYPHGTGLGLALVQRIIEGHRGLIQETGKPGEGALFEIYLPIVTKGKVEK